MNLNVQILLGHVGRDAEVRYLSNGMPVVSFSMATNSYYKKDDDFKEITTWHEVRAFGRLAESLAERNVKKGDLVFVMGETRTDQWEDKDGNKRTRNYVFADKVKILSGLKNNEQNGGNDSKNNGLVDVKENADNDSVNTDEMGTGNDVVDEPASTQDDYDDLPF